MQPFSYLLQPLGIVYHTLSGSYDKKLITTLAGRYVLTYNYEIGVAYLGPEKAIAQLTDDTHVVPMALVEVECGRNLHVPITQEQRSIWVGLHGKVIRAAERYHRKDTTRHLIHERVVIERQRLLDLGQREAVFTKRNYIHRYNNIYRYTPLQI